MSSHAKNDKEPELDPYAVLGVPHTASDADINKAFKRLALKLHPDKQQQQQQQQQDGKSGNEKREGPEATTAEEAFHQVQWAKSFLLDAEFADQRRRLDAQRASRQARRVVDETRSASMSDKRRRMRDELQRQEQQASHHLKYKRNNEATATSATASSTHEGSSSKKPAKRVDGKRGQKSTTSTTAEEAMKLERLRRQGNEMREAYADRQEEQMTANAAKSRRREQQQQYDYVDDYDDVEQRQVRLKWSRKKLTGTSSTTTSSSGGGAMTESTLMQILKRRVEFGDIERIEMLGHKGNAALVTFVSADSCRPCVDALLDSEEMRATFVGKRKEREEEEGEELDKADGKKEQERRLFSLQNRDAESVADWKLRRAAEREELLRQVERDEDTAASGTKTHADSKNNNSSSTGIGQKRKSTAAIFPPFLPNNDDNNSATMAHLSPFERLQQAEVEILEKSGILSKQEMRALQAAVAL
jgi:curved DNA-binding protein CbpA